MFKICGLSCVCVLSEAFSIREISVPTAVPVQLLRKYIFRKNCPLYSNKNVLFSIGKAPGEHSGWTDSHNFKGFPLYGELVSTNSIYLYKYLIVGIFLVVI